MVLVKRLADGPTSLQIVEVESDRLERVLTAAANVKIVNEVRRELSNIASPSVREELRSDKRK
jgi:hypothetical protein